MIAKGATDTEVHAITDALTLDGYTVDQTRCEIQVMIDGSRRSGYDNAVSRSPHVSEFSIEALQLDRSGRPACNHANLVKLLTEHSDWLNVFVTDTFDDVRKVLKPLPNTNLQ
tara:strand:- start:1276 stop:1614 length:339 start_codon:yes stop_codon:yes gene_type:complete